MIQASKNPLIFICIFAITLVLAYVAPAVLDAIFMAFLAVFIIDIVADHIKPKVTQSKDN